MKRDIINFNDNYWLTNDVLAGIKTMTRRLVPDIVPAIKELRILDGYCQARYGETWFPHKGPQYKVGDVVAIAQSYHTLGYDEQWVIHNISPNPNETVEENPCFDKLYPAYKNKLFVRAQFMAHHIRITDVKVERLQDISDADCIKEGIFVDDFNSDMGFPDTYGFKKRTKDRMFYHVQEFKTPKIAFENLISSMMGKATWDKNPWVFVYTFDLID